MGKSDIQSLISRIFSGEETTKLGIDVIRQYHSCKSEGEKGFVAQSTWTDLEMDDVFSCLNRTCSTVGAQYLYHKMHCYGKDITFPSRRYVDYQYFQTNQSVAKVFAKSLIRLRDKKAAYISNIIYGSLPVKPFYFPLLLLMSFLFAASIAALIFVGKEFLLGVIGIALLNSLIQHILSFRIYVPDMGSIGRLLSTAIALSNTGKTD